MKDTLMNRSRDVIKGTKLSREALYYSILFGVAFVVSVVILVFGIIFKSGGLIAYASVLTALFLVGSLAAVRFTLISRDTIYVENGQLVIKSFTGTKSFKITKITKLSAVTDEKNVTKVKITTGKQHTKYKFRNLTKEDIANLKSVTSK